MKIVIGHLYPDLLNLYGDRGNIIALESRLKARNFDVSVIEYALNDEIDFDVLDIVFIGGGSDREQALVCSTLRSQRENIKNYVENGGVLIAVCGGYQLLGKFYKLNNENIEGLGILDIYTQQGDGRLIGNIVLESNLISIGDTGTLGTLNTIVGFENHGGRTYIGDHTPLGKVISGYGNNDDDGYEGVVYKNVIATYLHGPLLPKNPCLTDHILKCAIEKKYGSTDLAPLDDTLENMAHDYIVKKCTNRKDR